MIPYKTSVSNTIKLCNECFLLHCKFVVCSVSIQLLFKISVSEVHPIKK